MAEPSISPRSGALLFGRAPHDRPAVGYIVSATSAIGLKGSGPRRRGHAPTRALTQATGVPPDYSG
jgi:hypothetical protein